MKESEKALDPEWNLCQETARVPKCGNHTVKRKGFRCGTCYNFLRRQKNPEYIKLIRKCDYDKRREYILAAQRVYYDRNRERILKYQKEYRDAKSKGD